MEEWAMTVSEAAARFGVPRRTLHSAITRGALAARQIGPIYVVRPSDVQHWVRHGKHQPGPPRKPKAVVASPPAPAGGPA